VGIIGAARDERPVRILPALAAGHSVLIIRETEREGASGQGRHNQSIAARAVHQGELRSVAANLLDRNFRYR
jgi:hypothetical protein